MQVVLLKGATDLFPRLMLEWLRRLLVGERRTRIALAVLVSTTLYGISRSCDSDMPSVSTNLNSRCCFNSSGSRDLPSEGERERDLQMLFS